MTDPLVTPGPRVRRPGGTEVATWDLGGSGPPLLLVHATGLHGLCWLPLATHLRSAFRCFSFDLRGHGRSDEPPDGDYRWTTQADDALAVCAALGLRRPLVVGHSIGGAVAVLAEERSAGSWQAMYCWEPILFDRRVVGRHPHTLADIARRRRETFASRQAAYDNYAAKAPFSGFDPAALCAYVEHGFEDRADGSVRLRCRPEAEAAVYEAALDHDGFDRLGTVGVAVALACGGDGADIGPEALAGLARRLPKAETRVFPELGHFGPLQAPATVASSIREMLAPGAVPDPDTHAG